MEKNWNSVSLSDNGVGANSSCTIAAAPDLFNASAADGRGVKLREKSSKFIKISQRGIRSRPFSCDVENLSKTIHLNDAANSQYCRPEFVNGSRFKNANLGDRRLNGSFQLLNTSSNELNQRCSENDNYIPENSFENSTEPLTLELYEKSPGPLRIYERRNFFNNQSSVQSHRYPAPAVRKMQSYANDNVHVLRSSSHLDLQNTEVSGILENNMKRDNFNEDVNHVASNVYLSRTNVKPYPEGMASLSDAAKNGLLPRREYGSASSIDQLLTKQDQARQNVKQHSSVDHSRFSKIVSSATNSTARSSSSSVQKQISTGPEHFRASLRREKAIDFPNYSSVEPTPASANAGKNIPPTPVATAAAIKESKSVKKEKVKTSRTKSGNESILKKLIGVGLKTHSADLPDNMSTPVGSRDFVKPDFSSDSSDFKYEEKNRRKIFAHFDCASICADTVSLMNGAAKLKDSNFSLNSATGASQASRPKVSTNGGGVDSLISPANEENGSSPSDVGDGKSNSLVLSCPFFRNELGGEPFKAVALGRDNPNNGVTAGMSTNTREDLETWLRVPTAAEASVIENLSNVYLGGRLCAKRQENLVVEHVDQGAFFYRHCFAGKGIFFLNFL